MKRNIVHIIEEKCNGCGVCVPSCAEGAIQIINGKAMLVADIFCDGLGACLGHCPQDAIFIEERDAAAYDETEVQKHLAKTGQSASGEHHARQGHQKEHGHHDKHGQQERQGNHGKPAHHDKPGHQKKHEHHEKHGGHHHGGCPGSALRSFSKPEEKPTVSNLEGQPSMESCLSQWPVQLMLVPPSAPFLKNSDLVICADCVPFTVPDFHPRYLKGRSVLVACPKLDDIDHYRGKLADVFREATPKRITVLRMEVPCCGGLAHVALEARNEVAPKIPFEIHIVGIRAGIEVEKH